MLGAWSTRHRRSRPATWPGKAAEITRLLAAASTATSHRAPSRCARALPGGRGARERVALAERDLRAIARLYDRWGTLADRLAGLAAEVEDVAAEVRALRGDRGPRPGDPRAALESAAARSTACCAGME